MLNQLQRFFLGRSDSEVEGSRKQQRLEQEEAALHQHRCAHGRSPKNIDRPRVKRAFYRSVGAARRPGRIEAEQLAGQGTAPRPKHGSESAVTNPGGSESDLVQKIPKLVQRTRRSEQLFGPVCPHVGAASRLSFFFQLNTIPPALSLTPPR